MKRILLVICSLLVLVFIGIYIFIPAKIVFAKIVYIKGNINIANKYIADESNWGKWWPVDSKDTLSAGNANSRSYKNSYYISQGTLPMGVSILIKHTSDINSVLQLVAINTDSLAIEWKGNLAETYNPFKKISNYLLATEAKKNVSEILESAKRFLESNEKIYGLNITREKVKDTFLISTKFSSNSYPSTAAIYNLVKNLKEYISLNSATETNFPMLHITQGAGVFNTMVAIPVDRIIPQNNTFLFKRMIPGKILVAEVKGGPYTTSEAIRQLEIYIDDNHLSSPAIPFESLITNREKEPDTLKWVTKIYYPIY